MDRKWGPESEYYIDQGLRVHVLFSNQDLLSFAKKHNGGNDGHADGDVQNSSLFPRPQQTVS